MVRRLLQRVGLGPRPGEVDAATRAGFEATLARLTAPSGPDAGIAATPPPDVTPSRARGAARRDPAVRRQTRDEGRELTVWWLDRMAAADQPFPERLAFFWHGHFATSLRKVRSAGLMLRQNATFRALGGGDFRLLARAMVVDPAMLVWLDGTGNRVGKPNENLAREFMELFTLGIGRYTEDDVRAGARALTGWGIDANGDPTFSARAHDPGPVAVLGTTAALDAPAFVDLLLEQPASARHLAGRVWTRFVADPAPDAAALDPLMAAYGPGRDVTALVRAAARSPMFADASGVLVRQPVEWLVGGLRAVRAKASDLPPRALDTGLTGMGQVPFAPPDVGGWPAGRPWLSTTAALARLGLAKEVASVGDLSPVTDVAAGSRVDAAADLLGLPGWTDRTRAALAPLTNDPGRLVALAMAAPENTVSA